MFRALLLSLLLLLASNLARGQSYQRTEYIRPCTLRPVNGRICLSEEALRGRLLRYVAPKLPEGADENAQVVLHVVVPRTGGNPTKILVIAGDPALARSAVRAVREWSFDSYVYHGEKVGGENVGMEGDLHIRFKTAQ
jgi:hypothetical protein